MHWMPLGLPLGAELVESKHSMNLYRHVDGIAVVRRWRSGRHVVAGGFGLLSLTLGILAIARGGGASATPTRGASQTRRGRRETPPDCRIAGRGQLGTPQPIKHQGDSSCLLPDDRARRAGDCRGGRDLQRTSTVDVS